MLDATAVAGKMELSSLRSRLEHLQLREIPHTDSQWGAPHWTDIPVIPRGLLVKQWDGCLAPSSAFMFASNYNALGEIFLNPMKTRNCGEACLNI